MKQYLFYQTPDWGCYWRNFLRCDADRFLEALRDHAGTRDLFLTRSGRAGILLSLRAFGLGHDDEVLVPRFMSSCVLDPINRVAKSSLGITDRTKAVLFYHQWGYPQDYRRAKEFLDGRNLFVIEDCAHGLWGSSQNIPMGTFGHTVIFSPPKIFQTTYVGLLRVNDSSLRSSIEAALGRRDSFLGWVDSLRGEWEYLGFYNTQLEKRKDPGVQAGLQRWYATLLEHTRCSTLRGALPYSRAAVQQIFLKQNQNFLFVLKNCLKPVFLLPGDEVGSMAPVCFPVLSEDESFLRSVDEWLRRNNIFTGIYHFDIARNMFAPDYRRCVPLPLYPSIPQEVLEGFVREFKGRY
jgi:hypothetical protein